MNSSDKKTIAVFGATGHQGAGVVRALKANGQFKVRALTRQPDTYQGPADEVIAADMDRPETLAAALAGAHGVFLVTNYWQDGTDEMKQATSAIDAAKAAGVDHMVWSTLPNVEAISGGKISLPQFTGKAKIDLIVEAAGFTHHTFVVPPAYYQNFSGPVRPQKQQDGGYGWVLPIDPSVRCFHMGDIGELGRIVAGAFAHPEETGKGVYLPLVGDFLSFGDIVNTLNQQGHQFSFTQVPTEVFAGFFPGAAAVAENLTYYENYTYLGPHSFDHEIALANRVAGKTPTTFAAWAAENFRLDTSAA
ncbi:NmrA/HSCARG family protein [Agrobacterium tumefaciens]|uniref:Nucleoside-diphosphate sugar epimerase n=3 Tax=Rhizobium/Agrobacterium group TaxID=227290 RepID=A0A2Z2PL68_RHIRH|nr:MULTISPECIES: NmrA/HSCARG family protein [Rhizobium/Agrobacterium group]ASK42891.1 nucleoside-diphosphate sugar epimerase [Rhizobium rhizogenes]TRB03213.1 NmrA/HSCARG family protein [Agrobacterium tumefaciens]TRB16720.1 NmrA/HSCARG family protein [Agrobacterium tumefaciens]